VPFEATLVKWNRYVCSIILIITGGKFFFSSRLTSLHYSTLRFFSLIPAMGTEPVTAGVSWQNTIENRAHCEKHRQLVLVSGWEIWRSIQQLFWGKMKVWKHLCGWTGSRNKNYQQGSVLNEMVEQDDQVISVKACCRLWRINRGAMTFFC